jgi:hypothetical protein
MTGPSVRWVPATASDTVASARLRAYRPAAALGRAGWDSAVVRGRWPVRADIVVFQKAYEDHHVRSAQRLRRRGSLVVFDICDNHFFHESAGDPALLARAARLRALLAVAHIVTVSTPELATFVDHPDVRVVDDALEPTRPTRSPAPGAGSRLVWFGNAGSEREGYGLRDLGTIVPALESLARQIPFHLTVLSNSREAYERHIGGAHFSANYEQWTVDGSEEALTSADVALIPVTLNDFTRCKTGNRVVTALQSGLAVVASRVPSYEEYGTCIRFDDWEANLALYLRDGERRAADVIAGQRYIADRFPPDHLERQWTNVLTSAVARTRVRASFARSR